MYAVELFGTVKLKPFPIVIGPTNMALTLAGIVTLLEMVFGFATAPARVNAPVPKIATFATPATVTATSPPLDCTQTLELPFSIFDTEMAALIPVKNAPLPTK